jgi:hypothetical protein
MDGYVMKPINPQSLQDEIKRVADLMKCSVSLPVKK